MPLGATEPMYNSRPFREFRAGILIGMRLSLPAMFPGSISCRIFESWSSNQPGGQRVFLQAAAPTNTAQSNQGVPHEYQSKVSLGKIRIASGKTIEQINPDPG